jgi:peptidoglycan hydrolase-like protein with peptidoglycan-binding domain
MQGQPGQSAAGNRNQREQTTTGQSERNLNQAPSAAQTGRNAPQGQAQQSQPMGQSRQGAETTQQAQGVSVTPQQRTRIRETVFASNNVPRVDNVNFAVRVGTTVPSSVHLVVVPETLVEVYPQWRDDEYFVVRDEVVIVDHSHRIVAVVPTGSSSASSSSSESAYASSRSGTAESINLSQDEIRQLQITLNQRGFNVGEPDGNFGPRTRAALMQFQQREGLQRTGQIDRQTMSALRINAGGEQRAQGGRGPSSTGQPDGTQQPSAANPNSGAGMNAGGTSSGATPSTSGQSGATGNTTRQPSDTPGAAGTSSPSSSSSGRAGSSVNPSGGAGTSTGGARR